MQAVKTTLAQILRIEGNTEHYHVPKYQREYSWRRGNWEQLIQDIDEDDEHFMGSVICVHDGEEAHRPNEERVYEVVDGQQRLTTLSLLLAAIYSRYVGFESHLRDADQEEIDAYRETVSSLRRKLLKKKKEFYTDEQGGFREAKQMCFLRVQPSSQNKNLEDYKFILAEIGLLSGIDKPKNCGNRSLYKAFRYFAQQIPDDKKQLNTLIDRLNKLVFIHISVPTQSNAFMLFESLNNRGVPLSALDIIKNKMLSDMEARHKIDIDESYEKWQRMLANLPDAATQERFLRQFYNAFKIEPAIQLDRIPRATSSTLIGIYEQLIKRDAPKLFDALIAKAQTYNQFVEPGDYESTPLFDALIDLQRIGAAAAYTFLLYLFSLSTSDLEEKSTLIEVVRNLCKYFVRRNVTDTPATRNLDAIFIELIEQMHRRIKRKDTVGVREIMETLLKGTGKPATDEVFVAALGDNLYYNNAGMARYLLVKLDSLAHSREYKPDLWARNDADKYVWTVEHVFPQGENIPSSWVTMVAGGDKTKAKEFQDEWVHCLGNLTLSGYNSKLSNQSFEKKQAKTTANVFGYKIQIGYRNGLALNQIEFKHKGKAISLATAETWSIELIQKRNEAMVGQLAKLYELT